MTSLSQQKCSETYTELVRKFCMLGVSDAELPAMLGVDSDTVQYWRKQDAAFAAAIVAGRAVADATVADRLYARAIGFELKAVKVFQAGGEAKSFDYVERYPPDVQACIFWLRNRRRALWNERGDGPPDEQDLLGELEAAGERARHARI